MKQLLTQILECLKIILPFIGKSNKKASKEFSDLITGQYEFLVGQLEKMLKDYFELSTRVKEMHTEIFNLKDELDRALSKQCNAVNCSGRI